MKNNPHIAIVLCMFLVGLEVSYSHASSKKSIKLEVVVDHFGKQETNVALLEELVAHAELGSIENRGESIKRLLSGVYNQYPESVQKTILERTYELNGRFDAELLSSVIVPDLPKDLGAVVVRKTQTSTSRYDFLLENQVHPELLSEEALADFLRLHSMDPDFVYSVDEQVNVFQAGARLVFAVKISDEEIDSLQRRFPERVRRVQSAVRVDGGQIVGFASIKTGSCVEGQDWFLKEMGVNDSSLLHAFRNMKRKVQVAVIDSGISAKVPELTALVDKGEKKLADKHRAKASLFGYSYSDDGPTDEKYGHGTAVSSIASGLTLSEQLGLDTSNLKDSVGVIPIRVSGAEPRKVNILLAEEAVELAVAAGAKVVNLSFRSYRESEEMASVFSKNKDVLFVVAAGNDRNEISKQDFPVYPALHGAQSENVIVVSSYRTGGFIADHSNWGEAVEVSAPGEEISTYHYDGTHQCSSGTSMAAPFVSLAAAIIFGQLEEGVDASRVRDRIVDSCDRDLVPTGRIPGDCRLNMEKAISLGKDVVSYRDGSQGLGIIKGRITRAILLDESSLDGGKSCTRTIDPEENAVSRLSFKSDRKVVYRLNEDSVSCQICNCSAELLRGFQLFVEYSDGDCIFTERDGVCLIPNRRLTEVIFKMP